MSRTFISVATDKELIDAKNWANIIDHFRTFNCDQICFTEQHESSFMSFI